MPETEFLNPILNSCVNTEDEKEAFAIQNTLYALSILLNAAIENEAVYAKGVIAIDDTAYECKGNVFPADLIARYGFWRGAEGYHLETARALFWPFVTIILDLDSESVEKCEEHIETELRRREERNYFSAAINTADLQGEWLLRAQGLFGLVPAVSAESASAESASATPPAETVPADLPAETKSAVRKNLRGAKITRRTHGRRALTPPRTSRLTAFTRSHK